MTDAGQRRVLQHPRARRWWSLLVGRVARLPPDRAAMVGIVLVVLAANAPYLLDVFDPNPLGPRSALSSSTTPGLLGGGATIDPNNGYASQALGHLAADDLVHLRLPWWNPYEGTGMPLAGEMQPAAFFPPAWLTLVGNGQLFEHILLEIIAGLATFALLRRLRLSPWAAAPAGVAFALNGTFAWLQHATVNPVPMLPLLLLGIEVAAERAERGRSGGWGLLVAAAALSFVAGFPEVTYIDALLALCWFAWRLTRVPRARRRLLLGKAAAAGAVALLLCTPLLIAMADYFSHAHLGAHGSTVLGNDHFGPSALPQLLFPYAYGPIFAYDDPHHVVSGLWATVGGYLTALLLLLALLGLLARGHRGLRLTLVGFSVLVFARIYGLPLLFGVIGVLPDMSRVAFFRYGAVALEMPVIILAAVGLDDLLRTPVARRRVILSAAGTLVLVVAGAVEARSLTRAFSAQFAHRPYFAGSVGWAVVSSLGVLGAALLARPRLRAPLVALIVVLDAVGMFALPEGSAPRAVTLDRKPVSYLQRHLGTSRFFTLGPLQPNYGSYFRLRELNVNDLPPKAFATYVHQRLDPVVDPDVFVGNLGGGRPTWAGSPAEELLLHEDAYRQAGVAYVLTPARQPLPGRPESFRLVFRSPTTWIYRLAGAPGLFSVTGGGCSLLASDGESARVRCSGPGSLERRETAFPGWSADIDGHPARLRTAQGLFQVVSVSAGSHRIRFHYQPPHIAWGWLAFACGWLWLILSATGRRASRWRIAPVER